MVQVESNVIKKWRFCWLHPPREHLVDLSSQISNDRQLPPPHHEIIILSRGDIGKRMPPPHHEKIILSRRDKFQMKKKLPPPHHEKIILSRRDKSGMKKEIAPTPPRDNLVVSSWPTQSHIKATTDNPLSNRVAMAICCRVLHSATCWHVQMSAADLQRAKWSPFPLYPVVSQAWWP